MPITVKHGGGNMESLAKLAVLMGIGRGPVPQLPQMPSVGAPSAGSFSGGGGGIRHSDPFGFGNRAPLKYGPSEEESLRMKSEAEDKRQKMVLSAKQEQHNANIENSMKELQKSDLFSSSEKMLGMRDLEMDKFGIDEGTIPNKAPEWPKLQDENGNNIPRGEGNVYRHPQSGALVRDVLKDGQMVVEVVQRHDQGPEAAKRKTDADAAARIADAQAKQQERNDQMTMKLLTEPVKGTGPEGRPIETRRKPEEVRELMEDYLELTGQLKKPPKPVSIPWQEDVKSRGYEVTEEDKQLPEETGRAVSFLRTLKKHYGSWDKIPAIMRGEAERAKEVLERNQYAP